MQQVGYLEGETAAPSVILDVVGYGIAVPWLT